MDDPLRSGGDAAAIIDAAMASARPYPLTEGGVYVAVVPVGHAIQVIDDRTIADRRADRPRRPAGTTNLSRAESFTRFVETVADGPYDLYADVDNLTVTAVFNPPRPGLAGWSDHRAVLCLMTTPAWQAWKMRDGTIGQQVAFAEHLEDRQRDVVNPDGATLLELVQTFEAASKIEFKSAHRLANGQRQLQYLETINATSGNTQAGSVTFPESFSLFIAPFEGIDRVHVDGRIRYRLKGSELTIGYILDDPDEVQRQAFDDVLAVIQEGLNETAMHGIPA